MPGSTKSSVFPDINVWVALTHSGHVHHEVASDWFADLSPDSRFYFCRFTQLGFLRLISSAAIMGENAMNQPDAWTAYDGWLRDERVDYLDEPLGLDDHFRSLTRMRQTASKDWADSYLAAFAISAKLVLVTFDRALRNKGASVLVLSA